MDLQLTEDIGHTRREWRAQRIAWVVLAVVIMAALLGVFGTGPLSSSEVRSDDGLLTVSYERFNRDGSPTVVEARVEPQLFSDGEVTLELARSWVSEMRIDQVTPQPAGTALRGDAVVYRFAVGAIDEPVTIVVDATVDGIGTLRGHVTSGRSQVAFSQYLYP